MIITYIFSSWRELLKTIHVEAYYGAVNFGQSPQRYSEELCQQFCGSTE